VILLSRGRAAAERLFCHKRLIMMHAQRHETDPGVPPDAALIRISRTSAAADTARAVAAMRAAGEPAGSAARRFARGDEFIGWQIGHATACFGWITSRDRRVGHLRLTSRPSTVYLYNFHTAEWARGGGLYSSLLLQIRHLLGMQGINDFIIDANERNLPSLKGMQRAGFRPLATVTFLTLFGRWNFNGSIARLSPTDAILKQVIR